MLCFSMVLWLRWLGKSAPKNGRVTIWKSESLKHRVLGKFFEVQSWFKVLFVWQAQGFGHSILIKIAKNR